MIRTPSIKKLLILGVDKDRARALKALLIARRGELEAQPAGRAHVNECWYAPKTSDLRMHCLDAELGTHGVESFLTYTGELVEYLNAGDTYAPTIVRFRGTYRVTSWGDIAERHGSK